jgi:hypothetical protein
MRSMDLPVFFSIYFPAKPPVRKKPRLKSETWVTYSKTEEDRRLAASFCVKFGQSEVDPNFAWIRRSSGQRIYSCASWRADDPDAGPWGTANYFR